jgi:hypothetical protein
MPDLRTILRSFSPSHAVRNARRDVVEHARVVAEIDAIVRRLPATAAAERGTSDSTVRAERASGSPWGREPEASGGEQERPAS